MYDNLAGPVCASGGLVTCPQKPSEANAMNGGSVIRQDPTMFGPLVSDSPPGVIWSLHTNEIRIYLDHTFCTKSSCTSFYLEGMHTKGSLTAMDDHIMPV